MGLYEILRVKPLKVIKHYRIKESFTYFLKKDLRKHF